MDAYVASTLRRRIGRDRRRARKPLTRGQPGLPLAPGIRRSAIVAQLGRDVALAKYPVTSAFATGEKPRCGGLCDVAYGRQGPFAIIVGSAGVAQW
jgi:hypothetical protein